VKKTILAFTALIFALLVLFQLSRYSYFMGNAPIELIIAGIALTFFFIGIYLNKKSLSKKAIPQGAIDQKKITQLGISKREYEVLVQIANGMSNKEIADTLYVSESTIKTHVSQLLVKLDVKRRTQAIQKAKNLRIITY